MISVEKREAERLLSLHKLHLLDTPSNPAIEGIVKAAAQLCDSPIALVTLLDEQRQWFKANYGLEGVSETARSIAFCDHTIRGNEIMVIEDAREDGRFKENALVTGDMGLRFYAGVPLATPRGDHLGALCVLDRKPKSLLDSEKKALSYLAEVVVDLLLAETQERKPGEIVPLESASGKRTAVLVIEQAKSLLIAEGLEVFSLRKVAEKANITLGNLQYHFANKKALLNAVAKTLSPTFQHYYQNNLVNVINPVDRLVAYTTSLFEDDVLLSHLTLFNIFALLAKHDKEIATTISEFDYEKNELVASMLMDANADLKNDEAMLRAVALNSLLVGTHLRSTEMGDQSKAEAVKTHIYERVVRLPYQPL